MRIFIGIPLGVKEKKQLQNIQKTVMEKSRGGRFTDVENFHLTLKFIGEIPEEYLREVKDGVQKGVEGIAPFTLVLQGFGTFSKGKTRIPWLGVREGREGLRRLQENIEGALAEIGYEKESRPFQPHMTFGRKVSLSSSEEAYLQEILQETKVPVEVTSVAVMESTRKNGKLVYPVIEGFSLGK